MNNGICVLAQNNETTNYVEQTYALALSIIAKTPNAKFSIITNDMIPSHYKDVFDQVISIPGNDTALNASWKIENRWKVYQCSPYDNTLVFDSDMIVLDDITPLWNSPNNITFTENVTTYRNELVTSRYYRKTFDENKLPNIYTGMYQFRKHTETELFFNLLNSIIDNWQDFYEIYTPIKSQNWCSIDLSAAIASKILDSNISNNRFTFTHMKPQVQNWKTTQSKWTNVVPVDFGNSNIYIGGYKQSGILHYVEDEFLTPNMLSWLEEQI